MKDLPSILSYGLFTKHIVFNPSPPQSLRYKTTEVIITYFPSSISETQRNGRVLEIQSLIERNKNSWNQELAVSYGWGVENDFPLMGGGEGQTASVLVILIGSNEDVTQMYSGTTASENIMELIQTMEGLIESTRHHLVVRSLGKGL